jgi:ribosomal protein L12E/L44/L45/RPP1/RPP2
MTRCRGACILVFLALLVGTAACGSDDDSEPSQPAGGEPAATETHEETTEETTEEEHEETTEDE